MIRDQADLDPRASLPIYDKTADAQKTRHPSCFLISNKLVEFGSIKAILPGACCSKPLACQKEGRRHRANRLLNPHA